MKDSGFTENDAGKCTVYTPVQIYRCYPGEMLYQEA